MKSKSIGKNVIFNVIRASISVIFPLILFPYVSRVLGPENLGKVNFATSFTNYFILLSSLGIPAYGVIACAKVRNNAEKLRNTVCELLYINFVLIVVSSIMLCLSVLLVPKLDNYRLLLLINSTSLLFNSLGVEWLYAALENFGYITLRTLLIKLISLVLVLCFIKNQEDYVPYAIITVASTAIVNVINFIHARKYIKFVSWKHLNIKRHLKPIMTFFAASLAGTINANVDTVMLEFFKGDFSVGIYTFSVKIKSILVQMMTAGLTVFVPRLSEYAAEKKYEKYRETIKNIFLVTMFISLGFAVYFCVFTNDVIMFLGGEQYTDAILPMRVLMICIIVLGITWTLGVGVLQPLGKEKEYTKVMFIATLVNVSLNAVLIPKIDVFGAALATLITEIVNSILFYHYSKQFLKKALSLKSIAPLFFSSVIAIVMTYFCFNSLIFIDNRIVLLIVSFITFGLLYALFALLLQKRLREFLLELFKARREKNVGEKSDY